MARKSGDTYTQTLSRHWIPYGNKLSLPAVLLVLIILLSTSKLDDDEWTLMVLCPVYYVAHKRQTGSCFCLWLVFPQPLPTALLVLFRSFSAFSGSVVPSFECLG